MLQTAQFYCCIKAAAELKLPVLTLYAFSNENWQSPKKEVSVQNDKFIKSYNRCN